MKHLILFLAFSFVLLNNSNAQEEFNSSSAQKAIDEGNDAFSSYFTKGDSTAMAGLYADDAIVLPPNMKRVEGHDDIAKLWGSFIKMGKVNIQLSTTELTGSGNIAVETGNYNLNIKPEGKDAMKDHGKYLVIWRKQNNNSWKMIRDMFSSNLPPNPGH